MERLLMLSFKELSCPARYRLLKTSISSVFKLRFEPRYVKQECCSLDGDVSSATPFLLIALILILLTWRIWRAPNNASRWQTRFNLAFKGLRQIKWAFPEKLLFMAKFSQWIAQGTRYYLSAVMVYTLQHHLETTNWILKCYFSFCTQTDRFV